MPKKTLNKVATKVAEATIAPPPALEVAVGPDLSKARKVDVAVQSGGAVMLVDEGQDSQVLAFRGAEYHLPKSVVASPLPTLTFRHLEKVTMFALEGKRDKVQSAVQRAIASAIDTASLVKIACVAHSEGLHDDAKVALFKAIKCAKKDEALKAIALSVSEKFGYSL